MAPTELRKNSDPLRGYIASIKRRREKMDLYGPAGTPIFEALWLMYTADTHGMLGSGGGRRTLAYLSWNENLCPFETQLHCMTLGKLYNLSEPQIHYP